MANILAGLNIPENLWVKAPLGTVFALSLSLS
jgi:hypothetical protein